MKPELKAFLEKIITYAEQNPPLTDEESEEYNACDWAGGNFDDAFINGVTEGTNSAYWELAQEAKDLLKIVDKD